MMKKIGTEHFTIEAANGYVPVKKEDDRFKVYDNENGRLSLYVTRKQVDELVELLNKGKELL